MVLAYNMKKVLFWCLIFFLTKLEYFAFDSFWTLFTMLMIGLQIYHIFNYFWSFNQFNWSYKLFLFKPVNIFNNVWIFHYFVNKRPFIFVFLKKTLYQFFQVFAEAVSNRIRLLVYYHLRNLVVIVPLKCFV